MLTNADIAASPRGRNLGATSAQPLVYYMHLGDGPEHPTRTHQTNTNPAPNVHQNPPVENAPYRALA